MVSVNSSAIDCPWTVVKTNSCITIRSATNRVHGYGATTGMVSVTSSAIYCLWTVVRIHSWLVIVVDTCGMPSSTVNYSVGDNPSSNSRTGIVLIAGQSFRLAQDGTPCDF